MVYTAKRRVLTPLRFGAMDELTPRQENILKAIIQEYTDTGEPVGSEILERKYKLGVSPATIRNEMVALAGKGYLKKTHFSAGRVPSAKGFRYYISNIMREKQVSTIDEVAYKNSLWDDRAQMHRLLSHAAKVLADKTGVAAVAATSEGDLYYSGVSNLFNYTQVLGIIVTRQMCTVLDQYPFWQQVMQRFFSTNQDVFYMLGEEDFADPIFEPVASIVGDFRIGNTRGVVGLLGPKQMKYDVFIPQVRYFSNLLEEIASPHVSR
jgi:heat-inducible transcriptional repressor